MSEDRGQSHMRAMAEEHTARLVDGGLSFIDGIHRIVDARLRPAVPTPTDAPPAPPERARAPAHTVGPRERRPSQKRKASSSSVAGTLHLRILGALSAVLFLLFAIARVIKRQRTARREAEQLLGRILSQEYQALSDRVESLAKCDPDLLRRALECPVDGMPLLHHAVLRGPLLAIRAILEPLIQGNPSYLRIVAYALSSADRAGDTPFHKAVRAGNVHKLLCLREFFVRCWQAGLPKHLARDPMLRTNTRHRVASEAADATGEGATAIEVGQARTRAVAFLLESQTRDMGQGAALIMAHADTVQVAMQLGVRLEVLANPNPNVASEQMARVFREQALPALDLLPELSRMHAANGAAWFHVAAELGQADAIPRLVERGGNVNARHLRSGLTALHEACVAGNMSVVEALLQARADPNARSTQGLAPLHLVCQRFADIPNPAHTVRILVQNGASTTQPAHLSPILQQQVVGQPGTAGPLRTPADFLLTAMVDEYVDTGHFHAAVVEDVLGALGHANPEAEINHFFQHHLLALPIG